MGDPAGLDDLTMNPPSFEDLCENTRVAYPDMDASPTKAWMVHHRSETRVRQLFEMGFGKFPPEELYDLRTDPCYLNNVVEEVAYTEIRQQLSSQLMTILQKQKDPRIVEPECRFERPPFTTI